MKLSMDIISDYLCRYDIRQIYGTEAQPILESIRLLHRYLTELDPQYLYMGIPEDVERLHCDTRGVTVISTGVPCDYSHIDPDCNLYFVQNEVDFGQFYNEVEDVFTYYNSWSQRLDSLCSSMAPLQSLIDASDEIIPYPISLTDGAERTIAYSRNKSSDDTIWDYIRQGYIKTEYLLRDNVRSSQIAGNRVPVQVYTTASNRYVMLQPIIVHQHTVAFVSLNMTQAGKMTFQRSTEHLLAELSRAIVSRMEADEFFGASMGVAIEFFLADMISRKLSDRQIISDRAHFFAQDIHELRCVLCFTTVDDSNSEHRLRVAREALERLIPKADSCTYRNYIVFVQRIHDDVQPTASPELMEAIGAMSLLCGISVCFDSLYDIADHFDQAQAAIRFGRQMHPKSFVYHYESYISMYLLERAEPDAFLHSLIHPVIRKLILLYGEEHHMLQTLYVYLLCERNISNAAKQLHVHRNTLLYRIEQLSDKLQNDFSDAELAKQLLFSFEVLLYYKKCRHTPVTPLLFPDGAQPES